MIRTALAAFFLLAGCAHSPAQPGRFTSTFADVCEAGATRETLSQNAVRAGFHPVSISSDRRLERAAHLPIGPASRDIQAFERTRSGETLHVVVMRFENDEARFTRCALYDLSSIAAAQEVIASRGDYSILTVRPFDMPTYVWQMDGYDQVRLRVVEPDGAGARAGFSGLMLEYDQVEAS